MAKPSLRNIAFVLLTAVLWWGWRPEAQGLPVQLALAALVLLVPVSLTLNPLTGLLVLVSLIPAEYSAVRWGLPSLSPIDLLIVPLAFSLLVRRSPAAHARTLLGVLTPWGFFFWAAFLACLAIVTVLTQGAPKGLLRWGEFLFFILYAAQLNPGEHPLAPKAIAGLMLLLAVVVCVLALPAYWQSQGDYRQLQGPFHQNNILAAFLSLALPLACGLVGQSQPPWRRLLIGLAVFLTGSVFLLSFSRGAFLGLTAAVLTVLLLLRESPHRRRIRVLAAGGLFLLIALGLIGIRSHTGLKNWWDSNGRVRYWQVGGCILEKTPWTGTGPGRYLEAVPSCLTAPELHAFNGEWQYLGRPDIWQHLHNVWLQTAVEYGIPAAFLLMGGLLIPIIGVCRARHARSPWSPWQPLVFVGLFAFFIHNGVDILFVNSLDLLFAIYLRLARPS